MKIHNTIIPLFIILLFSIASLMCGCTAQLVIDLNKYVSITYDGKNGGGTANYIFDFENFEKDYAGKIIMTDNAKIAGINDLDKSVARLLIDTCVIIKVDSDEEYLSNGETVTLSWDCNEAVALDYFNCELDYKDIEEQVSGLRNPDEIDPFEYSHLLTTFYSPFLDASLEPIGEDPLANSIVFTLSKNTNLKTGDVVKATANYLEGEKKFIHDFGCKFNQTEKEYTIDSTARFVSDIKDVQPEFMPKGFSRVTRDGWRKLYWDYTCDYEGAECYVTTDNEVKAAGVNMVDRGYHSILVLYSHCKGVGISEKNNGKTTEFWSVHYLCDYYIDENGEYGFLAGYDDRRSTASDFHSLEEAKKYVSDLFKNTLYVLYE